MCESDKRSPQRSLYVDRCNPIQGYSYNFRKLTKTKLNCK